MELPNNTMTAWKQIGMLLFIWSAKYCNPTKTNTFSQNVIFPKEAYSRATASSAAFKAFAGIFVFLAASLFGLKEMLIL